VAPHQTRLAAEAEHLTEEVLEHRPKAAAELGDGMEIGLEPLAEVHEGEVVAAGLGQLTRGVDAPAGAVKREPYHRLGMEGRSPPLGLVGLVDGAQVQLGQHLAEEVGRITGVEGLGQRGRQKEGLVGRVSMVWSHA
jgi:hypothetical protein